MTAVARPWSLAQATGVRQLNTGPAPPRVKAGEEIVFAGDFSAIVLREHKLSGRLLDLEFNRAGEDLWRGNLSLREAGNILTWKETQPVVRAKRIRQPPVGGRNAQRRTRSGLATAAEAQEKGIQIATAHARAGLSATGDAGLIRRCRSPNGSRFLWQQ